MRLEEALADDDAMMWGYVVLLDEEGNEVSERAPVGVYTTIDRPATRHQPGSLGIHVDREVTLTSSIGGVVHPTVFIPGLGPAMSMPLATLGLAGDQYHLIPAHP